MFLFFNLFKNLQAPLYLHRNMVVSWLLHGRYGKPKAVVDNIIYSYLTAKAIAQLRKKLNND